MRIMRRLAAACALGALVTVTSAHVGSPDTWFQGQAGPYPVSVVIRLPGVVPGLGRIDVTVTGNDVTGVTVQPVIFNAGADGAPPPDAARRIDGQRGVWYAELWFMEQASYRVRVEVTGALGRGVVEVPVVASALQQTPLAPWLAGALLIAGTFLFVGAVTIVRAAATDAITPPHATPPPSRAAKVAPVAGAGVLALALWGGWNWWGAVERDYQANLYRPVPAKATIDTADGARTLVFTVADSNWMVQRIGLRLEPSPIIPDHGKLMHLFLIEQDANGTGRAFGHFHPVTDDSLTFRTRIGALAPGRYDVYADVVHETGFPQSLIATVDIPPPLAGDGATLADEADAIFAGSPEGDRFSLADGASVSWNARPDPMIAGRDAGLRFTVREPDGAVARLSPYLGMAGHAVVQRADGGVYIHLHPNGTVSMGAQQALAARRPDDTLPGMVGRRLSAMPRDGDTAENGERDDAGHTAHRMHIGTPSGSGTDASSRPAFDGALVFPYAFPEPGDYRVWVQFMREGRGAIETAVFRVEVR